MTHTTIIESPDGAEIVISDLSWGTAQVTGRVDQERGLRDLWDVYTERQLAKVHPAAVQGRTTNPAPVEFCIKDIPNIYSDWHVVAEVDDTTEFHIRLYPERMQDSARRYFGLADQGPVLPTMHIHAQNPPE